MTLTILNDTLTVSEGETVTTCVEVQTQGDVLSSFNIKIIGMVIGVINNQ